MKTFIISFLFIFLSINMLKAKNDSISYSVGYANDVYYSFKTGTVKTSPRDNWDVAFATSKMSSSILINDGAGVELYTYPKGDTSDWNSIDTAGLSNWKMMYNSELDWEQGAFSQYEKGHPDYGWGVYNSITHNIHGDSIFIIKSRNGDLFKLWLVEKASALAQYTFKFAPIGANDTTVVLDCLPYSDKNYLFYDLETKSSIDREPMKDSWDIEFTKFEGTQPSGGYYAVTGVKQNIGVEVAKISMTDTSITDWGANSFSDSITTIGWSWKSFSMTTFTYNVEDSLVFFVNTIDGDVYKLIFTEFVGSTNGNVYFRKSLLSNASIGGKMESVSMNIFPNPTSDLVHIDLGNNQNSFNLQLFDISGRKMLEINDFHSKEAVSVSNLPKGIYFLRGTSKSQNFESKLVIK